MEEGRLTKKSKFFDRTGLIYSRLKVLERDYSKKRLAIHWICQCSCGNIKSISGKNLQYGKSKSCGCLSREITGRASSIKGKKSKNWSGFEDISGAYFASMKKGAIRRGISFEITMSDIWDVYEKQNRLCALTGYPIVFSDKGQDFEQTCSVDRINNDFGYTVDNIQITHKDINCMKWWFTEEQFIKYCRDVVSWCEQKSSID